VVEEVLAAPMEAEVIIVCALLLAVTPLRFGIDERTIVGGGEGAAEWIGGVGVGAGCIVGGAEC